MSAAVVGCCLPRSGTGMLHTLHSSADVGIAMAALVALLRWKLPPWVVVAMVGALSAVLGA